MLRSASSLRTLRGSRHVMCTSALACELCTERRTMFLLIAKRELSIMLLIGAL
jgi:hypothetical protein